MLNSFFWTLQRICLNPALIQTAYNTKTSVQYIYYAIYNYLWGWNQYNYNFFYFSKNFKLKQKKKTVKTQMAPVLIIRLIVHRTFRE